MAVSDKNNKGEGTKSEFAGKLTSYNEKMRAAIDSGDRRKMQRTQSEVVSGLLGSAFKGIGSLLSKGRK